MFCFSGGVQRPVRMLLVLHEDEVPELEEAVAARAGRRARPGRRSRARRPSPGRSRVGAARGTLPTRSSPGSGRNDPLRWHPDGLPLLDRDLVGRAPAGSPAWIVTRTRSQSSFSRSWMNSRASSIAPALKYCPNEEVAEHLEEGEVMAVVADLVDVGRAKALLRSRSQQRQRLLPPEEERHLRLHPPPSSSNVEWSSARGTSVRRQPCVAFSSMKARKPSRSSALVCTLGL